MDEVVYELRPLTLFDRVWMTNRFKTEDEPDGIKVFAEYANNISESPESILNVAYRQMQDNKHHFKNERGFRGTFFNRPQLDQLKIMSSIGMGLMRSFGVSEPDIKDIEMDAELKKSRAVQALEIRPVSRRSMMHWPLDMVTRLRNFMRLRLGKFTH